MASDDEETAQTVSYMDELAAADSNDRAVLEATHEALSDAGLNFQSSPLEIACAVYWWLKRTIRYVPTPGTSPLVDQTLITPCAVLAMPEPIGDCPQFSMLAAAMFRVCCIDSLFVTIAAEPKFPDQWSHIYNTVEVLPGRYMPFDSSNGPEPGAEYARPFKRRVWPRIAPGRTKEGSKDMMRSMNRSTRAGMRNAALRGAMGVVNCDQDGNCYDSGSGELVESTSDPSIIMTGPGVSLTDPALNMDASNTPSGGSGGTSWLNTLVNDAAGIGTSLIRSQTTRQPYFITSPSGQSVLYNPNTGTVAGGATSLSSAINPTVILIGLGLFAAIAVIGKK